MLGILLMTIGALLGEASAAANKLSMREKTLNYIDTGILVIAAGLITFLVCDILMPQHVIFDMRSLPTLTLRLILEIPLTFISGYALMRAERSTFALLRSLTIPLLLVVDLMLAYPLTITQVAGALVVTLALIWSARGKISRVGMVECLISAVMAVATISLFKHDIKYNSVLAEQTIALIVVLISLVIAKLALHQPMPTHQIMTDKKAQLSLVFSALSSILEAFAFKFVAGTALVTAAKRGIAIIFAIFSGRAIFHEENLGERSMIAVAVVSGLALMATPPRAVESAKQVASVLLFN
jgi:hypothetical protein